MAEKREHPQQHLKHMKKTEIGLLKQKIANNHMQKIHYEGFITSVAR